MWLLRFVSKRFVIGAICLWVLIIFTAEFVPVGSAVSFDEAAEAIRRAENDLELAFVAVVEAEVAGADVSAVVNNLDAASTFLSEADLAFSVENYESAVSSAVACSRALEGVFEDAARLKSDEEVWNNATLSLTLIGSVFGIVLLLICSIFGWRFLKKSYFRRIADMKPEVEGV